MGFKKNSVGCCCCPIGYQGVITPLGFGQYPQVSKCFHCGVENVFNGFLYPKLEDVLSQLKVLLMGAINCGFNTFLPPASVTTIANWVHAGGRLYFAGEFSGTSVKCLDDAARVNCNNFLNAIGCSIQIGTGIYNCGCVDPDGNPWLGVPQPGTAIMDGLPGVFHACVAEVTGGSPMCNTTNRIDTQGGSIAADKTFIAIESVAAGYVMVAADSNITSGCPTYFDNCALFKRFYQMENLI